ncbi:AraC family transcriptional regulator [Granulicella sp. S156]|uniref:helix-turn-helix transcriptional regulator n=1 Tax=Granulicella sp. S156 TaxID=1747224 RepID=UPI00131A9505|nr:AraC family transcriptional regulator [Granulicella sp. S156]
MTALRLSSYAANNRMSPHLHEDCTFTVVVRGDYQETIRSEDTEHCPGSMLFYPAGEVHSQQFGSSGSSKLIFVPTAASLEFLSERGVALAQAPHVRSPAITQLARRVIAEKRHDDSFSELTVTGLLLELIAEFGRLEKNDGHHIKPIPAWLRQIREQLQDEPEQSKTNEELAASVGKHPVHLAKAFRGHFGETMGEYQRRLRLQKAEVLLRKSKVTLVEVALACGFASHSHMSRSFRAAYGISPSRFRSERL